jgi:mycothiol synthase
LLAAAIAATASDGGGRLELWIEQATDADDVAPRAAGFAPWRDLWQLRCGLPVAATDLETRPFTNIDAEAFLAVNNRAFAWHPEQGSMTLEDLRSSQAQPWFDPDASAGPRSTPRPTTIRPSERSTSSPSTPTSTARDWAPR